MQLLLPQMPDNAADPVKGRSRRVLLFMDNDQTTKMSESLFYRIIDIISNHMNP